MSAPTPAQLRAADPRRSVWVTANAGTGKTRVLSDRVLRLLLDGAHPETLLCITFTKAAAAEMALRVDRRLAGWAVAKDRAELAADIAALTGTEPDDATLDRARRLFARVLDLPQGLPILTIHALCGMLLRRFPLEAGIAPHFEVIDERTAEELLAEARDRVLREGRAQDPDLATAIERLATQLAESSFAEVLAEALAARTRLVAARTRHGGFAGLMRAIARTLRLDLPLPDPQALLAESCADGAFDALNLLPAARALDGGSVTDQRRAAQILAWLNATPADRVAIHAGYVAAFVKKDGDGVATLATAGVLKRAPEILPTLAAEQARLIELGDRMRGCLLCRHTEALLRVAFAVIDAYQTEKDRAGGLDYDDLIERTRALLSADGEIDWVRYKLDARIDHVLVDEAQDTSPAQWDVIERLTDEFFAGAGARGAGRTLFVVGDEKQSIYSFQGADLANFQAVRARVAGRALAAGLDFTEETLDRSFRSVPAVLELVDAVFARPAAQAGVVDPERPLRHDTSRRNELGTVEVWPLVDPVPPEEGERWPLPDAPRSVDDPDRRLAEAIARRISTWLGQGERIEALDRPMRAGDILILLARRGGLQELLVRALKRNGVPVAGADRLELSSHIAVMDLVALGRAILLPEDDLNLACLLKSPLVGLGEDDLFALAFGRRPRSLLERLRELAGDGRAPFAEVYERLRGWIARADFMPPFEFYASVLGRDRGRERLLARLGPDAAEPIEAFLAQTLAYERGHPATLEGFLHWLGLGTEELKRDPELAQDAVRVMTVHGAKGLEAPVVILADAGPRGDPRPGRLIWSDDGLPYWRASQGGREALTSALVEARKERELQERSRLLYVALTRAGDRLYVTGRKAARGDGDGCWHKLVGEAIRDLAECETLPCDLGRGFEGPILRLRRGAMAQARAAVAPTAAGPDLPLPAWATTPAPAERDPARTRAPSRLAEESPPASSPAGGEGEARFRFGLHLHKLLQWLPELPAEARDAALDRYLEKAVDLASEDRERARRQVAAVLADPRLAEAFGPGSTAEQAICGIVGGVAITGQIDRLAVTGERVLILDYKTNRRPPAKPAETPVAYLRQMAAYRELLRQIYPDRPVEAALVWTESGEVSLLESDLLDPHLPWTVVGEGPGSAA
ncbi:MAG: double-strand break repair helicase AddA [Geminicoccaceae bacterium]